MGRFAIIIRIIKHPTKNSVRLRKFLISTSFYHELQECRSEKEDHMHKLYMVLSRFKGTFHARTESLAANRIITGDASILLSYAFYVSRWL